MITALLGPLGPWILLFGILVPILVYALVRKDPYE